MTRGLIDPRCDKMKSRNTFAYRPQVILKVALFVDLLVTLDVIANGKTRPAFESDTTFGVFAHLGNVLLDVLERGHRS